MERERIGGSEDSFEEWKKERIKRRKVNKRKKRMKVLKKERIEGNEDSLKEWKEKKKKILKEERKEGKWWRKKE